MMANLEINSAKSIAKKKMHFKCTFLGVNAMLSLFIFCGVA